MNFASLVCYFFSTYWTEGSDFKYTAKNLALHRINLEIVDNKFIMLAVEEDYLTISKYTSYSNGVLNLDYVELIRIKPCYSSSSKNNEICCKDLEMLSELLTNSSLNETSTTEQTIEICEECDQPEDNFTLQDFLDLSDLEKMYKLLSASEDNEMGKIHVTDYYKNHHPMLYELMKRFLINCVPDNSESNLIFIDYFPSIIISRDRVMMGIDKSRIYLLPYNFWQPLENDLIMYSGDLEGLQINFYYTPDINFAGNFTENQKIIINRLFNEKEKYVLYFKCFVDRFAVEHSSDMHRFDYFDSRYRDLINILNSNNFPITKYNAPDEYLKEKYLSMLLYVYIMMIDTVIHRNYLKDLVLGFDFEIREEFCQAMKSIGYDMKNDPRYVEINQIIGKIRNGCTQNANDSVVLYQLIDELVTSIEYKMKNFFLTLSVIDNFRSLAKTFLKCFMVNDNFKRFFRVNMLEFLPLLNTALPNDFKCIFCFFCNRLGRAEYWLRLTS